MTMRAIVLGGTGFLGLNIVDALRAEGADVACTRRRSSNTLFARRMGVRLVEADLTDRASVARAMEGREVVFMAATPYPRTSRNRAEQVRGAAQIVRTCFDAAAAAGIARVVFTSSVATIGPPRCVDTRATERCGSPPQTLLERSTYFAMKHAAEREALAAADAGVDVVVLNPTGCIGPYDHRVGTGTLIAGVATGALTHWVDGWIDIVDARDVARAHVVAARCGRPGERTILSGMGIRVRELLARVGELAGTTFRSTELAPRDAEAFAVAEEERSLRDPRGGRPALTRALVDIIVEGHRVDNSKARAELGFVPRPLDESIQRALTWYRNNGYLRDATR